jgi:hypothetical protein
MTNYKSALTPFLSGAKLEDGRETPLVDSTLYKQLVGNLLYLTHSRPNLSYEIGAVSRFMQELHEIHWKDTKCILRYVQGSITFRIHYATESTLDLIKLTDFNWASNNTDRKSISGYSLSFGSGPIYWSRKKQASISLYLVEVEYKVVVNITI